MEIQLVVPSNFYIDKAHMRPVEYLTLKHQETHGCVVSIVTTDAWC